MRVKIECVGRPYGTRIINADTGAEISAVRSVKFEHHAGSLPSVELEILPANLSMEAAEVRSLLLHNPVTGETKAVKRIEFVDGTELDLSKGH